MTSPGLPALPGRSQDLRSRILDARQGALALLILVLSATLTVTARPFLTTGNLKITLLGIAIDAVLVVGQTYVIMGGGFDLSISSTLALSAVSFGLVQQAGVPWEAAAVSGLLVGGACGAVNGFLIAGVGVNPLIATLGTMNIFRGIAFVAANGTTVSAGDNPIVSFLGQGSILEIPTPVIVAALIAGGGWALLKWSRAGRLVLLVGGNREAARLSGIRVDFVTFGTYVAMGLLAGVAALLTIGRVSTADANVATGRELGVITAVVLGGASLRGGEGSVVGSVLALLFLAFVADGLILLSVPYFYQTLTVGTVLIVAVVVNLWRERMRDRLAVRAALQRHVDERNQ